MAFLFETKGGKVVIVLFGVACLFIWDAFKADKATETSFQGRIVRLEEEVKFSRARSALISHNPRNYDHYLVVKTDSGNTEKVEVPYDLWEEAKEGQKVVKEK